ncbi:hypothetical protein NC653_005785 [Populus alba x Populus x berolinensis]|uniref:Uncharacterized protein n=1 Tax=Populus alba x Populus x berolinensis TaxID=444605 RepID=A0AAD6RDT9_9ROSI|nr:hypothetical protein NC653_005785 [Populus alba x Populus x berolinensis]
MKSYGNVTGMKDAWLTLAAALDQMGAKRVGVKEMNVQGTTGESEEADL